MNKNAIKKKITGFWEKYELKIVLIFGFILISAISFEFGLLQGQKWQQSPLVIEKPALAQNISPEGAKGSPPEAQKTTQEAKISPVSSTIPAGECAFVGSKNSNKYHLPTCRWAKQIKANNLVCFKSAEDAAQKGYQPDKGCIK